MTDEELAEWLHLTPKEAAIVIPRLRPAQRRFYERARQVVFEAELWLKGEGPRPKGVFLD